ncbi:MAG: hypothetical protein ACOZIN_16025 [Myxococcota bacterium]
MMGLPRVVGLLALLLPVAALAARVRVPVDVGVGPAAYYFFGPVADERWPVPHFGLKLNVEAVIDQNVIRENRRAIPPKYLKQAEKITELRVSPSLFIPDALILSPQTPYTGGTGIYGITWRPLALTVPLFGRKPAGSWKKSRGALDFEAGLLLTYAFLHSETLPTTHFLRPGIDLTLELELAASDSFLVSMGWASQLYVPQQLGSFDVGQWNTGIFHVGQAFLQLHVRFPYETSF